MDSFCSSFSVIDLQRTRFCVCVCVFVSGMCACGVCVCVYMVYMCVCVCECVCGVCVIYGMCVWGHCVCVGGLSWSVRVVWFLHVLPVMGKNHYPSVGLGGHWCAMTYVKVLVRGDKAGQIPLWNHKSTPLLKLFMP